MNEEVKKIEEKYEIYQSSEEMKKKTVREKAPALWNSKYPFDKLEVGESFVVPDGRMKLQSLRNQASIVGSKMNKIFAVINHGEKVGYEVGRLK